MKLLEATGQRLTPTDMTGFRVRQADLFQPRKTILLAEDDDDLRCIMELTLTAMGYHVIACPDAFFASAAFRLQPHVDILLTDFEMPGRSGLELARELAALSPSLPILIVTGSMMSTESMQEIYDRHWIYISKPCHLPALEATLYQLLQVGRLAAA